MHSWWLGTWRGTLWNSTTFNASTDLRGWFDGLLFSKELEAFGALNFVSLKDGCPIMMIGYLKGGLSNSTSLNAPYVGRNVPSRLISLPTKFHARTNLKHLVRWILFAWRMDVPSWWTSTWRNCLMLLLIRGVDLTVDCFWRNSKCSMYC